MKQLKSHVLALILFSLTTQMSAVDQNDLFKSAVGYGKIGVGIGLFLGGLYGSQYPLIVVYENCYKPAKKKILQLTAQHPLIGNTAKYTIPLVCLAAGFKLIQDGRRS